MANASADAELISLSGHFNRAGVLYEFLSFVGGGATPEARKDASHHES